MATPDNESVEYDIRIEATLALKNLADLTNSATSFKQRILETTTQVKSSAQQWGISFQEAKQRLQTLDAEFSGTAQTSVVFGGAGQAAWDKVGEGATKAGDAVDQSSKKMVGGINIVRTALHVLVVGAIFEVINAFKNLFTGAIEGLKKMEVSVYNLANAERSLSESGVAVTFKDLEAVVDRLHGKFEGLFSRVDLQDMVADIAIATKELGLNADQIEKIAASAAALQLRNPEKTVSQISGQLLTAILSGQTKGIRSLGVEANEATIQQKALEMGLIKTGEAANAQQKSLATLELVYEATSEDAKNLTQYQNTLSGAQQELAATWKDLLAELGKDFAPLAIQGIKILIFDLQVLQKIFQTIAPYIQTAAIMLASFMAATKGLAGLSLPDMFKKFTSQLKDAKESYIDYFKSFNNSTDTPTGSPEAPDNSNFIKAQQEAEDKVTEIFKDARDKRLDIDRDYQNKLQDIRLNLSQKLEDIARSEAQKQADAQQDYADKVEDINRDASEKEQDARTEANKKSVEIEKKYQDDLKNLRDKYLMDLEDALHERDARQILHLMKQYEIDKNKLKDQRDTDKQQSEEQLRQKLQDIERDRQLKLQEAKRDLADKLRDIKTAAARERQEAQINFNRQMADARTAHQRALDEQKIFLQRKLRDLSDALAKEYNLTKQQLDAIESLYQSYGGSGTTTSSSSTGSASSPSSTNAGTYTPSTNSGFEGSGMYGTTGAAEGGTFLATRPMTLNVAENRPELLSVAPLGAVGRDVNKFFSNGRMEGGRDGQIEVALTLSPDLEARITRNTLGEAANIVAKINRSKI